MKLFGKQKIVVTEDNFAEQLKRGNEQALEYVAAQYGNLIYAVVRKHLANLPQLQEECVNDVLLAIWQNIDRYDQTKGSFENYLAGICRYKAIDCKRKWLHTLQEQSLETAEWVADHRRAAEFLEQEIFEEVEQMLSCLKPEDQALFRKLYLEGYTVEQTANAFGMQPSNVYNRVSRGRRRIREHYSAK